MELVDDIILNNQPLFYSTYLEIAINDTPPLVNLKLKNKLNFSLEIKKYLLSSRIYSVHFPNIR